MTLSKFNITDLFEIKSGIRLTKEDLGEPIYPYIGASAFNNGITEMCDSWQFENVISVNEDGSVGYAFYHPYKFQLSDRTRALIPKFNITENIGVYLSVVLTKSFIGIYNYNLKLSTKRLQKESIYLPEKDGEPDWEYIEDYMNQLKPKMKY